MAHPPMEQLTPENPVSTAPGADAPAPRCQPPANVRREVQRYDQAAAVGVWEGPRYHMTYRTLGEGPALVWVPGIASTYRVYALVLNRLAERFRTIQYEYPGDRAGDGARLGKISHDHLAADLFGLMDHLGLDQAFVAGISFGATVVLSALAADSRRFPRAVVQGGFSHRKFTTAERMALALGRCVPGAAARLPLRERILSYNSRLDFPSIIEDRWPFYLEQNGLTPIRALAHRTSLLTRLDLRPSLNQISTELLLIQGREDRIVPLRYFEELKTALPRSESVVMPTVGHIPHLTHAEALARVIGGWLSPCAESGGGESCPGNASAACWMCGGQGQAGACGSEPAG